MSADARERLTRAVREHNAEEAIRSFEELYGDGTGAPHRYVGSVLQLLLSCGEAAIVRRGLGICARVGRARGAVALAEGLLASLAFALVGLGEFDAAEEVTQYAAAQGEVRIRSFRPLLQHYAERGDREKIWKLYKLAEPLSTAGTLRIDDGALVQLLVGLAGAPKEQHEVLVHYADSDLSVGLEALEELARELPRRCAARCAELVPLHELAAREELSRPLPEPGHAGRARAAIQRRLDGATLSRLRWQLMSGANGRRPTCVVDGANVGYRGAVQRGIARNVASKAAPGEAAVLPRRQAEVNPHAEFFRYDQIAAAVKALEQQGELPLVVLPARYTWRSLSSSAEGSAVQERLCGPQEPASGLVRRWFENGMLFVVPDEDPDDLVWMYAALLDLDAPAEGPGSSAGAAEEGLAPRPLFAITRDEASDHRDWIWGLRQPRPTCVQRDRAWRRWKALRMRWFSVSWAGSDHFAEDVTVHVDTPGYPVELQHRGGRWYLPNEDGSMWLRLQL